MSKVINMLGKRGLSLLLACVLSFSFIIPASMADNSIDNEDIAVTEDDVDIDAVNSKQGTTENAEDVVFENAIVPLVAADGDWVSDSVDDENTPKTLTDDGNAVFAIYSSDDSSLTFYTSNDVPATNNEYNGKTVTNVYTGFENTSYSSYSSIPWYSIRTSVNSVTFDKSFEKIQPISLAYWFYGFTGCTSMDMTYLDTSKVTTLYETFHNCSKITNVDFLTNWDTSNVTTLYNTFYSCSNLTDISGLADWDTSNVTTLYGTFQRCSSLTNVDALSKWNTLNVTSLSNIFYYCSGLANINGLAGWDVSNVTTLEFAFVKCPFTNVNGLSEWNTSKVTSLYEIFMSCTNLANIDGLSKWDTSNVTTLQYTFQSCSSLTNVDALADWKTSKVTTLYYTFRDCPNLTNVDGLSKWDTSNVTDLRYTFYGCTNLVNIDGLSKWNTSNVTTLYETFYECNSIDNADAISNWDTSKVTSLYFTFRGCTGLTEIDVSKWDTSKVTDIDYMFYNCSNLETIYSDDSVFVTSAITSMDSGRYMFSGCTSLVGGNGTEYSSSKISYTMAHVDTEDDPGYFTEVHHHKWKETDTLIDSNHITVTLECELCGFTKTETVETGIISESGITGTFDIDNLNWHDIIDINEMGELEDGSVIDFTLGLENINDNVSDSDTELVKNLLKGKDAQVFYLSIDLAMVVTSGEDITSYELTDLYSPITITLDIPENMQTDKSGDYTVIRVHDDEAEKLDTTANREEWTVTFQTDKFSTYALAFVEDTEDTFSFDVFAYDSETNEPLENPVGFLLGRTTDEGNIQWAVVDYDSETGEYYFSGEWSSYTYNCNMYTNEDGYIHVSGLEYGDYLLCNNYLPEGYQYTEEYFEFTINEDGTLTSEYLNDDGAIAIPITMISVNIYKTSDKNYPLEGAEFIIGDVWQMASIISVPVTGTDYYYEYLTFDQDSDTGCYTFSGYDYMVDTREDATKLTTDENGYIYTRGLPGASLYFLIETKAPDGYELLEDPIVFWIDSDGTITVYLPDYSEGDEEQVSVSGTTITVMDENMNHDFYLNKVTENGELLNGAIFHLNDENGELKFVTSTDSNGNILYILSTDDTASADITVGSVCIDNLPSGKYTLTEYRAPTEYIRLNEDIVFTIDDNGMIILDSENNAVTLDNTTISVINESLRPLPNTGGIGTVMWIISGAVVLAGATCAWFGYRKKIRQ